ncbi:hypothetical protein C1A50_2529 [Paenibacillus polymyxa]|nr:hypothetical protein C1A50_2529 [Paenibacillus polymyxa]
MLREAHSPDEPLPNECWNSLFFQMVKSRLSMFRNLREQRNENGSLLYQEKYFAGQGRRFEPLPLPAN